jgi:hypothetical protein
MSKNKERPMGPHGPVMQRLYDQEDAGNVKPGNMGWWRVWGARAMDIKPGDLVICGWKDKDDLNINHYAEYEVMEMAKFTHPTMNTIRVGFITSTGKFASVGMLQAMQMVRWTDGNKLADSI